MNLDGLRYPLKDFSARFADSNTARKTWHISSKARRAFLYDDQVAHS